MQKKELIYLKTLMMVKISRRYEIERFWRHFRFQTKWNKNFKLADPIHNHNLFILAEKEIKRIENNEDISKFKPLIKLYDRADIINDIA